MSTSGWPRDLFGRYVSHTHEILPPNSMMAAGLPDPKDDGTPVALALVARTCAFLGDSARARPLYETLRPCARNNTCNGNEASFGSMSRYLGLLAATMSRWDAAARHFEDALELNTRWGARPWTALTQHDYAKMLLARNNPSDRQKAFTLLADALETSRELWMTRQSDRVSEARAMAS